MMEKGSTIGTEKIVSLFDTDTFVEVGAFVRKSGGELTGVVCGYGAIDGKLAYAFAQDSDRKLGAFDALQADKIASLYAMAMKNGAPVIGVFDSAGAMVNDGAGVLSAYGKLLKTVSDASGVIPQIAVVTGVCAGMAATVAAMFDVVIPVKAKAQMYVNAPFLVGKETGSAEYAAHRGLASLVAESDEDAVAKARKLIGLLPSNHNEGVTAEESSDDANRSVNVDGTHGRTLIATVTDEGSFVELGTEYEAGMITGFATFGGVTCGIVANDPDVNGGVLTCDGAKKAAKLVSLCDSFSIPVVTLVDSAGTEISSTAEGTPFASQLAKLAMIYSGAETAKVTAVVGKAYGAAFTLMGSKALGADMVYALPDSEISVMNPSSAVAFLWNGRITDKTPREALETEWKKTCASPAAAAADGSIDDVVPGAELRQRICAAIYMLMMKNAGASARRHFNLPL